LVLEAQRTAGCKIDGAAKAKHETMQEIKRLYRELIQRGIRQGALRAADTELYAAMLSGMLREVLILELESPARTDAEERAGQIVRMFVEGAGVS
jgi:hypothetical protein